MTKKIWTVLLAAGATAVWAGPFSVAAQETETLTEYTMETLHVASEETEHSKKQNFWKRQNFQKKRNFQRSSGRNMSVPTGMLWKHFFRIRCCRTKQHSGVW